MYVQLTEVCHTKHAVYNHIHMHVSEVNFPVYIHRTVSEELLLSHCRACFLSFQLQYIYLYKICKSYNLRDKLSFLIVIMIMSPG